MGLSRTLYRFYSLGGGRWTGQTAELLPLSEKETICAARANTRKSDSCSTPYTYQNMTVSFAETTDKGGADMQRLSALGFTPIV